MASLAAGDYDNDGDYDYIISGRDEWWSDCFTKIFKNNNDSSFTESGINLIQIQGKVAWGDYDNDNDLDLIITGQDFSNNPLTKIYRNDGNGLFIDIDLNYISNSQPVWVDLDNDGDLDIISTQETFINNGKDSFIEKL
ncbi:MAG: VCBS repeat-containing protein [Bacteroidetes bacterium]|nr:VCBS repeat-containing protein [Bacteroidota bacterium]